MGKLLFDCIDGDDRWQVIGFIDDGHAGETRFGLPVFAGDAYDVRLTRHAIMAVGYPATRRQMIARLAPLELDWCTYIDRRCMVGREAVIGRGAIVLSFAMVASGVRIGDFTYVSSYASVGTGSVVGSFTSILIGATAGESVIGDDCVLGMRSGCLDHATLGDGVTLAPYTLVRRAIPAGALVAGSPARIVERGSRTEG
jgi:carbonic anhydrase/acetyltransferase-like protein (isoleucine patch superfamily)